MARTPAKNQTNQTKVPAVPDKNIPANVSPESEDIEAEEEILRKKRKRRRRLILVVGSLLILLATLFGMYVFLQMTHPDLLAEMRKVTIGETQEEKEKAAEQLARKKYFYVKLPNVIVHLQNGNYLHLTLFAESRKDAKEILERFDGQIKDAMISMLFKKSEKEIFSPEWKVFFKLELASKINAIIGEQIVRQVLFTNLIIERGR